jgi:hypothetical protein
MPKEDHLLLIHEDCGKRYDYMSGTVKLSITFDSLAESIKELNLDEKYRLWELLEEQIAQAVVLL